jgi:hypothetical protein
VDFENLLVAVYNPSRLVRWKLAITSFLTMGRKYTDQDLIEAVESSTAIRQVLTKLGLIEAGGNYATIQRKIEELGLNTSHFVGQSWLKGKTHNFRKKPLNQLLVRGKRYQSYLLKNRILKEGLKKELCENCGLEEWLGSPIPLELHHKNGDHADNRLENLALLCPNCHAMTDSYRGKNIRQKKA